MSDVEVKVLKFSDKLDPTKYSDAFGHIIRRTDIKELHGYLTSPESLRHRVPLLTSWLNVQREKNDDERDPVEFYRRQGQIAAIKKLLSLCGCMEELLKG